MRRPRIHPLAAWLSASRALAFCGLALLGGAGTACAQVRQVLDTVPAGDGAAYELSLAACVTAPCNFELRLLGAARGEPLALSWPANAMPARAVDADPLHGAGTPLAAVAAGQRVWAAGEEEDTVTAAVRAMPLPGAADGRHALVATQMAGFEHPKRRHAIYVATAQGLRLSWSYDEPQGPYQSWVLKPEGGDPVLLVRHGAAQAGQPDRIEMRRLVWHANRGAFSELPSGPPAALQAVLAGRYASAATAHAARGRYGACLAAYAVLQTRATGAAPRYALAAVAVDTAEARAESARLRGCAAALRPQVQPLAQVLERAGGAP